MPFSPFLIFAHVSGTSLASGLTVPMPVMTILRDIDWVLLIELAAVIPAFWMTAGCIDHAAVDLDDPRCHVGGQVGGEEQ